MDVSCERCKAEYEFDDSLLGEHGTTVKCSSCGHVFRVVSTTRQPSRPSLKLRLTSSGVVAPLSSLRDLQRRIHAGEAGLEDELGRDGFPWRKLGDVPELRSFFSKPAVSQGLRASDNATSRQCLQPSPRPQPSPQTGAETARRASPLSVSQSSMPAPPRDQTPSANRTIMGVGPDGGQLPRPPRLPNVAGPTAHKGAASATTSQEPRAQAVRGTKASDAPTDPPPPGPSASRPRTPAQAPVPSNPVARLYVAEDEAPPARATEGSSRIWIMAGVAGAIALGGVLVAASMRSKAAPAVPRVEAAAPRDDATPDMPPAPAAAEPSPPARTEATRPAVAPSVEQLPTEDAVQAGAAPTAAPGETEEANARDENSKVETSREASESAPRDYGGWVGQGDAALVRGDAAGAQKAYVAALALRASGSEATTGLGYALLSEGKAREAIPYFERAARNGYAEASIGLGDAHRRLGASEAARQAYKTYLERLPGGARAGYVHKQLELLAKGPAETQEPSAPEPEPAVDSPAEPAAAGEYRPAGELTEPPPEPAAEPAVEATP